MSGDKAGTDRVKIPGTGSPYHYVAKDSGGTIRRDGSVGVEMTLSQDTWSIGDNITII